MHDNSLIRCVAISGMRRLRVDSPAATTALRELLHDPDPDVRIDCAFALGELRVASSTLDLVEVITHDSVGEARVEATKALGKIGVAQAVDPLVECIRNDGYPDLEAYADEDEVNPCWQVQSEAIVALGEITSDSVVDALISFISETDYPDLQDLGFKALVKTDSTRAHEFLHRQLSEGDAAARVRVVRALADSEINSVSVGELSRELTVDLNRFLEDENPDMRLNAARALAQYAAPPASLALCRLLLDLDKSVRLRAAELLSQSHGEETLGLLHDMLRISDPQLQRMIASILGQIGNSGSADKMCEMLAAADRDLQLQLIKSIGSTGDRGPIEQLCRLLQTEGSDESTLAVLVAVREILSRHGVADDMESLPEIRQVLSGLIFAKDRSIGSAALEVFARLHADPGEALLGFIQLEMVAESPDVDGNATTGDRSAQMIATDHSDEHQVTEDGLTVVEETIPLEEFLEELPNSGDPGSSTLASILVGNAAVVEEPSGPLAPEWIPIHAVRLLGECARLDDDTVQTLVNLSATLPGPLLREVIDVFSRVETQDNITKVRPILERSLAMEDREIRLAALNALQALDIPITDQQMIAELLGSDDPLIRQRAVSLLIASDGEESQQLLREMFADEDRQVCMTALASVRKENVNGELRTALFDLLMASHGELVGPIADALRRAEDAELIRLLLDKILDDDLQEYHWIFINALTETYESRQDAA